MSAIMVLSAMRANVLMTAQLILIMFMPAKMVIFVSALWTVLMELMETPFFTNVLNSAQLNQQPLPMMIAKNACTIALIPFMLTIFRECAQKDAQMSLNSLPKMIQICA